jgi:hypothetical protein
MMRRCWQCDGALPWYWTGMICQVCRAAQLVERMAMDHLHAGAHLYTRQQKGGRIRAAQLKRQAA